MITEATLRALLPTALESVNLSFLGHRTQGKVRDLYTIADPAGDRMVMVTTDRISAFDRVLGLIPCKGQALTQLAAWWFSATRDIIPSAFLEVPDPNVTILRMCTPLPVEVVVRGYITGVTSTSLWHRYALGERRIYGIDFPDDLEKNDPLPTPVITPTTKAREGGHDERITEREIVEQGLVSAEHWAVIREAAVALFLRGQAMARKGGLILVDTKYEFGITPEGEVAIIDEMHTPDSSRYWDATTYNERRFRGQEPDNYDKEYLRLHFAAQGYRGDGAPPPIPESIAVETGMRYVAACEHITGEPFVPAAQPAAPRIEAAMKAWGARQ